MRVPYIVGMGAAYTAALGLLVRRLRLPGRGYLPEKTLCSLLFVAVAAVCAFVYAHQRAREIAISTPEKKRTFRRRTSSRG